MILQAGVRTAEPWSLGSILAGVVLLVALLVAGIWLIRRYLDDRRGPGG